MLKALLKKQLLELNTFYFQNKKTGRLRSRKGVIGFIILYAALFIFVSFVFVGLAFLLAPLLQTDFSWLYYCLMGLVAVLYGTFGSVFNTYAGLYHAKDNDLLLSLPVPPSRILLVRLVGVASMSLLYSAMVSVPTAVVRFLSAPVTPAGVVCDILLIPAITILVTVISCALGWVVAWLSSRFKNKSWLTVIFALVFMGAYYYFCSNSFNVIQKLITEADSVGRVMRTWLAPFYLLGRAGEGHILSMLLFILLTAAFFALTWFILSRTFLRIVTKRDGTAKKVYAEKTVKAVGFRKALLRKELRRFTSSPTYMLNAGLGCLFMPLGAVLLLIKAGDIQSFIHDFVAAEPMLAQFLPVIGTMIVCAIASMNVITGPSVSLEGKNIWLAQSLPVAPWEILRSKLQLHRVLTIPPALFCGLALAVVLEQDFPAVIMMLGTICGYVLLSSAVGLVMNLKNPNLTWTNETVPVKQSFSVFITMFGGWVVSIGLSALYYPLRNLLTGYQYLTISLVVLVLLARYTERWLRAKGSIIFASL